MTLTIDTESKIILFSGCEMFEAVHFARSHEFDGYTVKKDLPAYSVGFAGTFNNPEPFNPEEVFRGILGKENPEYLESEVVENPITKLFILPNPESDAPKIDLSKCKKYTLEVGEFGEDVLVRGLSKEDIQAGWYLHRRSSDLKVVLMKSDE